MADGDYAFRPHSAAERLEALLQQENAWATLDFRRFDTKQIHTEDRMRLSGDDAVERARGQRRRAEMTLQCDQLPSIISGTDLVMGHPISIGEPDLTFEDSFCETDSAMIICELRYVSKHRTLSAILTSRALISRQDDLIRSRKQFHLRWLHDPALPHPLAAQPILDTGDLLPTPPGWHLTTVRSVLIGDLFLVEMRDGPLTITDPIQGGDYIGSLIIIVWNWLTGELIFVRPLYRFSIIFMD